MKLLNIKKIALTSALLAGNLVAVSAYAQTNLITGFTTTAGTTSGFTLNSAVAMGQNRLNADTNTISLLSGRSYTLSFNLNNPISTLAEIRIVSTGSFISFIPPSSGAKSYTFTSSTTSSRLNFNYDNGSVGSFSLSNLSLTDSSAPAPTPTPSGPSSDNTQASLQNTAQALQGTYTLQNSVLANSFAYDCNVFGANNVCVSAGGRNTAVSAANGLNNTSGLLIAGYRIAPQYRIGAYADQNLSVNNAGSTVNLGNNTPLLGLFAAWNERQDGTGSELKASVAYGQKNTTMTRGVVGSGATASEAGSGGSQLNSQGFQLIGKHGFNLADNIVVSPYVGIRYTQNNMGGYTESSSSSVTAPLTYSALNTNATTVLAGVGATYNGIPQTTLVASAGVESDTNTQAGSVNATGVSNLTPVNFNANPVKTRATASLGAYYDVEKNQRLGVTGIYRQESYQAVSTTTVMATYTVGF